MPTMHRLVAACFATLAIAPAAAADRSADEILRDFQAVIVPGFELGHGKDPSYPQKLKERQAVANEKRRALALEMLATHVDDPHLAGMLAPQWDWIMAHPDGAAPALEQIRMAAARIKGPKPRAEILSQACWIAQITVSQEPEKALREADAFAAAAPGDWRVAMYLGYAAHLTKDRAKAAAIHKRIVVEYPKTSSASQSVAALHRIEGIGRPFDLRFADFLTGRQVKTSDLKGKVVVVEFWDASFSNCAARLSKMKTLYEQSKGQGVEFVGVSLDSSMEGRGEDALRSSLTKHGIGWPQSYLAGGFDDDVARYWGIGTLGAATLPETFLVDADGNLATTEALGKLDTLLPEALARARAKQNP